MGGFRAIRHNELRAITASLLSEVCHSVATKLRLAQPPSDARLDICSRGLLPMMLVSTFAREGSGLLREGSGLLLKMHILI